MSILVPRPVTRRSVLRGALGGATIGISLPFLDALLALPPGSPLRVALGHANVITQFQASFVVGALDTKHVLFFVVWTAFFSFVATRVLEARRWW